MRTPTVESFDHAIRLRMPGRCQAVLDTHGGADFIEGVLATRLPVLCCEAVGELRAVVGQQFDDPDWPDQLEPALALRLRLTQLEAVMATVS